MSKDRKNYILGSVFIGLSFILTLYTFIGWYYYIFGLTNSEMLNIITSSIINMLILTWITIWFWGIGIYYNYIAKAHEKIKREYRKYLLTNTENEKKYQRTVNLKRY